MMALFRNGSCTSWSQVAIATHTLCRDAIKLDDDVPERKRSRGVGGSECVFKVDTDFLRVDGKRVCVSQALFEGRLFLGCLLRSPKTAPHRGAA